MADSTTSGSGSSTAVVAIIAILAILALVWFFFLRGGGVGAGDGATDINVDIDPGSAVENAAPAN